MEQKSQVNNKKTLVYIQRAIIAIALLLINFPFAFKTIEYSIPSNPSHKIYDFDRFGEYFTQLSALFIALIMIVLILFKDYEQKFKDVICVFLNMGLIFTCCFYYPVLSISGLVLSVLCIILLFLMYNNNVSKHLKKIK